MISSEMEGCWVWPHSGASHCVKSYVLRSRTVAFLLSSRPGGIAHCVCPAVSLCRAYPPGWPLPYAWSPLAAFTVLAF